MVTLHHHPMCKGHLRLKDGNRTGYMLPEVGYFPATIIETKVTLVAWFMIYTGAALWPKGLKDGPVNVSFHGKPLTGRSWHSSCTRLLNGHTQQLSMVYYNAMLMIHNCSGTQLRGCQGGLSGRVKPASCLTGSPWDTCRGVPWRGP